MYRGRCSVWLCCCQCSYPVCVMKVLPIQVSRTRRRTALPCSMKSLAVSRWLGVTSPQSGWTCSDMPVACQRMPQRRRQEPARTSIGNPPSSYHLSCWTRVPVSCSLPSQVRTSINQSTCTCTHHKIQSDHLIFHVNISQKAAWMPEKSNVRSYISTHSSHVFIHVQGVVLFLFWRYLNNGVCKKLAVR